MNKPESIHDYASEHFKEQIDALKKASLVEEKDTWGAGVARNAEDQKLDRLLFGTGVMAGISAEKKQARQNLITNLMGAGVFDEDEVRQYASSIEIAARQVARKELQQKSGFETDRR